VKKIKSKKINNAILIIITALLSVLFLLPLIWMVLTSFKSLSESMATSDLLPKIWTLENYLSIFSVASEAPIIHWLINTAIVTLAGTMLTLVVDVLAAYGLARLNIPLKKTFIAIIVGAMSIPGIVTLFPAYYMFRTFDLLNTYAPLIFPYSANVLGVYMIYSFLIAFPKELEEAATIDGASNLNILIRVVYPSIRPVVLTLGVITFLAIYNDYLWPNLVVSNNQMKTITIGLAGLILGANFVNPAKMMASTVIAIMPAIAIFLMVNKHLVKGINNTGLK
jgi:multiple sugar transport system permease protein